MLNLIIVDDDETLLEGLSTAVEWNRIGYTVSAVARDGREALEVMENHPCDVLLTDIRMGRMDGLKLAEAVHQRDKDICIVMMSAYDDFSYAQQAMRLGVEDYLLKPIDLEQLHASMGRVREKISKARSQVEKFHALNQRVEELSNQTADEYYRASGALNAGLIEHLCKVTLLGNAEAMAVDMERLWENILDVGGGSFLFTTSAINLLAGRLTSGGELTQQQEEKLHDARRRAFSTASPQDAMDCMGECMKEIAAEKASDADDISGIVMRAKDYVDAHFGESGLRIKEVAAHVGLSVSYFSTMFARFVGESFSDYLVRVRVQKAQMLLGHTNLSTYEIASRVGYDNPAYFSTLFKKITGMTASQYRKSFRNEP